MVLHFCFTCTRSYREKSIKKFHNNVNVHKEKKDLVRHAAILLCVT